MDALDDGREPYVPEELAARLVVGARVRVRISGECPFGLCCADMKREHDSTDGHRAKIIPTPWWAGPLGDCEFCGANGKTHGMIFIRFYVPYPEGGREGRFPAAELEPI